MRHISRLELQLLLNIGYSGYTILRDIAISRSSVSKSLDDLRNALTALDKLGGNRGIQSFETTVETGYARWANSYDSASNPFLELLTQCLAEEVRRIPHTRKCATALDAGCGTGSQIPALLERFDQVIGLDQSMEMLEKVSQKQRAPLLVQGRIESMPFPDAAFDVTLASMVLTHFPDLSAPISEIFRITGKNGTVVITELHPHAILTGAQGYFQSSADEYTCVRNHPHLITDYIREIKRQGADIEVIREVCWPAKPATSMGLIGHSNSNVARPRIQSGEPALLLVRASRR